MLLDSQNQGGGSSAWIVEVDPDSGAPLSSTRVPAPADAEGEPVWEAWSPVREEIALVFRGQRGTEIWIVAPDGSDARRALAFDGPWFGGVDWTADGDALVYGALLDGRIQILTLSRAAGGAPRPLTSDPANLMHPQVSPDGRWIAASRIRHDRRILRQKR